MNTCHYAINKQPCDIGKINFNEETLQPTLHIGTQQNMSISM
jgi:hypothetical protein